jgi:hypothetical protein
MDAGLRLVDDESDRAWAELESNIGFTFLAAD